MMTHSRPEFEKSLHNQQDGGQHCPVCRSAASSRRNVRLKVWQRIGQDHNKSGAQECQTENLAKLISQTFSSGLLMSYFPFNDKRRKMTYIAQRIYLPEAVKAILWDMDGVLLDTLGLDQRICDEILHPYFGTQIRLGKAFIRSLFAYHPEDFWRLILDHVKKEYDIAEPERHFDEILKKYLHIRNNSVLRPIRVYGKF